MQDLIIVYTGRPYANVTYSTHEYIEHFSKIQKIKPFKVWGFMFLLVGKTEDWILKTIVLKMKIPESIWRKKDLIDFFRMVAKINKIEVTNYLLESSKWEGCFYMAEKNLTNNSFYFYLAEDELALQRIVCGITANEFLYTLRGNFFPGIFGKKMILLVAERNCDYQFKKLLEVKIPESGDSLSFLKLIAKVNKIKIDELFQIRTENYLLMQEKNKISAFYFYVVFDEVGLLIVKRVLEIGFAFFWKHFFGQFQFYERKYSYRHWSRRAKFG